jgi:putative acetyltransferase
LLIRVEIPVDAPGIDRLLRDAFGRDVEAELVHRLREDGLLTLGIVATDDEGGVIGYAAFSPVWIDGEDCQWVGLAPLAVDSPYRHQGIARQLVYEGLDTLLCGAGFFPRQKRTTPLPSVRRRSSVATFHAG